MAGIEVDSRRKITANGAEFGSNILQPVEKPNDQAHSMWEPFPSRKLTASVLAT